MHCITFYLGHWTKALIRLLPPVHNLTWKRLLCQSESFPLWIMLPSAPCFKDSWGWRRKGRWNIKLWQVRHGSLFLLFPAGVGGTLPWWLQLWGCKRQLSREHPLQTPAPAANGTLPEDGHRGAAGPCHEDALGYPRQGPGPAVPPSSCTDHLGLEGFRAQGFLSEEVLGCNARTILASSALGSKDLVKWLPYAAVLVW